MKLVTAAEMRALEAAAFAAGATQAELMETAGRAVALAVGESLGGAAARRIVVLVGPGNPGGDGLVAARYLYDSGAEVFAYLFRPRASQDANYQALTARDIELVGAGEPSGASRLAEALGRADAVVDAVFGIGRLRPLEGAFAAALGQVRGISEKRGERRALLFAVDLPAGIDADSGAADANACPADVTLALGYSKVGLHTLPGSAYAGRIEVLDIGLPAVDAEAVSTELLTPDWARANLPARPLDSNKGTFGRVLIVAGSLSFSGAAALSAMGALRAGAGLVTLASVPAVRSAVAALVPEITHLVLAEEDGGIAASAGDAIVRALPASDSLLIGPGLGLAPGTQAVVRAVLSAPPVRQRPVVVDADGLNTLARARAWWEGLPERVVLTPHPGELARLSGESIAEVQSARLEAARRYAVRWRQTLVLKGAHSIIAGADGRTLVSPFATPALATAGTGDVLAGANAGLLAQGLDPLEAAGLGVYLHAAAAEEYGEVYGEAGLIASEVAPAIARVAARLRRGRVETRPAGPRAAETP